MLHGTTRAYGHITQMDYHVLGFHELVPALYDKLGEVLGPVAVGGNAGVVKDACH